MAATSSPESRRGLSAAAVSDENQAVWGRQDFSGYLARELGGCRVDSDDDNDDAKHRLGGRGLTSRKTGCLQPLQANDGGSVPKAGSFSRSVSRDSEYSEQEFDLSPLIKEELRNSIQKRRWEKGALDWGLEDYDKKQCRDNQLTPDDIRKREDRKRRNRVAAAKCRQKRRAAIDQLNQTLNDLQSRRDNLLDLKESLQQEKLQLQRMVEDHFALCNCNTGLRAT